MSFTQHDPATHRINRSELAVPGSRVELFEKAAKGPADVIFLDLEDAVAPDQKPAARKNIVAALNEIDWRGKTISMRMNGLDTQYMYRDLVEVLEGAPGKLDLVMIPKVGTAADVYMVDAMLTQIEAATGAKKRIGIEMIIETALGMANINEIAGASKRNESLHFGVADYAASIKAKTVNIGGPHPDYGVLTDKNAEGKRDFFWADPWHYALSRMVVAARAYGLRALDGPFGDFSDAEGFRAQARRSAVLGCEGKWAIHPSQVALANEVFSPSEAEVKNAKRVLDAMLQAQKEGKGAVALDGKLIDNASIKQAQVLVKMAERAGMAV
jgi:malyl-CoA/(S)-citramalyl-CoA lyase